MITEMKYLHLATASHRQDNFKPCFFFSAPDKEVGWLVDFGFNGPLRQYFSLYRAASQREGERGKKG